MHPPCTGLWRARVHTVCSKEVVLLDKCLSVAGVLLHHTSHRSAASALQLRAGAWGRRCKPPQSFAQN